ncbi:MAG TPA: glycosyltransferase [Thermosynechococcaceae cyanobacterium]
MRLLVVQYAGDYREAVERFSQDGDENYYAQKYSVESVAELGKKIEEVAVLVCRTAEPYSERLKNGVYGIGAGFTNEDSDLRLLSLVEQQNPTHLVVCTPNRSLLKWAVRNKVKTLALFADSFSTEGFRNKFRSFQLARLLNHPQIEWVANHNINSARSLKAIGVNPDKIVPWDWPAVITPSLFSAKASPSSQMPWSLLYVGAITESKGVGDVLSAIAALRAKNFPVRLRIAGAGETEQFKAMAARLNISSAVEFLGLVPNPKVVHLMREADAVVIPSRAEYLEGLPMTIYEALCSRTPIVASDHPMFKGKLIDRTSALVFPAANSAALAEKVQLLLSEPKLYEQLSENAEVAWNQIQIPVKFADLLNHWLFDAPGRSDWIYSYRLSSGRYS